MSNNDILNFDDILTNQMNESTKDLGSFRGDRLEAARLYRGMTIKELAEQIGVTKQSVSQYENNIIQNPSYGVLRNIMETLDFPMNYFFEEDKVDIKSGHTYFRALNKITSKEKNIEYQKTKLIASIYSFLNEYIEIPKLNLPEFKKDATIREKAQQLREFWGLGEDPVLDVIYNLEKNGIIVAETNSAGDSIDGYSRNHVINGEKRYIVVLGNDKKSATRRQFSAAHELGHIVLHDDFLELEEISSTEKRQLENEAHEFAAEFLLPKEKFLRDVKLYPTNLDYYKQLKKKWKVSISAMIVRANNLNVISYSTYQYLLMKMSKLGWRRREPLDDILIMEKPTVLSRSVDIIIENDILNEKEFLEELSRRSISLNRKDVEDLLGLEKDRLKYIEDEDKVINIKLK